MCAHAFMLALSLEAVGKESPERQRACLSPGVVGSRPRLDEPERGGGGVYHTMCSCAPMRPSLGMSTCVGMSVWCVCLQKCLHARCPACACVPCSYMWNGGLCFHTLVSCSFMLLCIHVCVSVPWSMRVFTCFCVRVSACASMRCAPPCSPRPCPAHRLPESGPCADPGGETTRPFP